MSLWKRICNIGRAEVLSTVKQAEDPVKLLELEINDLEQFQKNATEQYKEAFVNLGAMKNEYHLKEEEVAGLTQKAKEILDMCKGEDPDLTEEEAKERALKALTRKNKIQSDLDKLKPQIDSDDEKIKMLLKRLEDTRDQLEQKRDDLKSLRLRQSMNKSSKSLNEILSKTTTTVTGSDVGERAEARISEETAQIESEEQAIKSLQDISVEVRLNQIEKQSQAELDELLKQV